MFEVSCYQASGLNSFLLLVSALLRLVPRPFRYDLNQIPYDYTVEVRSRFKGLDLIECLMNYVWMEVHDIVQEIGIKTIPKKKKRKKAKQLSGETLQIAVKRREVKSKGKKERYTFDCRVPKK